MIPIAKAASLLPQGMCLEKRYIIISRSQSKYQYRGQVFNVFSCACNLRQASKTRNQMRLFEHQ